MYEVLVFRFSCVLMTREVEVLDSFDLQIRNSDKQ